MYKGISYSCVCMCVRVPVAFGSSPRPKRFKMAVTGRDIGHGPWRLGWGWTTTQYEMLPNGDEQFDQRRTSAAADIVTERRTATVAASRVPFNSNIRNT